MKKIMRFAVTAITYHLQLRFSSSRASFSPDNLDDQLVLPVGLCEASGLLAGDNLA